MVLISPNVRHGLHLLTLEGSLGVCLALFAESFANLSSMTSSAPSCTKVDAEDRVVSPFVC